MKNEILGIDVSKSKLDVWLHFQGVHAIFTNDEVGYQKMIKWALKITNQKLSDLIFCFEHTGIYSLGLSVYLKEKEACYYVISGLLVKRSLGLARGKNDKVDSKNLARFLYLHKDELTPYSLPSDTILKLRQLLTLRSRLIKQRGGFKAHLTCIKKMNPEHFSQIIIDTSIEIISTLNSKIKAIESEIKNLISVDLEIETTFKNITSIKGVGLVLATSIIIATNNFKSFKTWRKFACYAGIAPFEHSSGSSVKGRTKISSLGNREIKTLLNQAALSAIQYDTELKLYFKRRTEEGKNKMSTINIVRNKLVSRIFAIANRGTPYVDLHKFVA